MNDRQSWRTPQAVFRGLESRWVPGGFTLDAAASDWNALCPVYLTKEAEADGLRSSWSGERVWCNPEYRDIMPWVEKAAQREAEVSVLLLPVRASSAWWRVALREAAAIDWIRGRVNFEPPPGVTPSSNPEASVAFIFRRPFEISRGEVRS